MLPATASPRHPGLRESLEARGLRVHDGLYPRADAVARLGVAGFAAGQAVAPEDALPVYVRDEVATVRNRSCHATAII